MTRALRLAAGKSFLAARFVPSRNGRSPAIEGGRKVRVMATLTYALDKMPLIPGARGAHREAELFREILAGLRDLFDVLIEPHLGAVRRAVRAKMGNDPEIDDVTQQAVFKASTHLEQFRHEGRFRTWLIRIALNEVILRLPPRLTQTLKTQLAVR